MIGAFTLAVIAAAFMFVFWFSGVRTRDGVKTYKIVFTSSVSGLSRGARVLFNGLNVGEVKKIDLEPKDPGKVFALIEVARNTPVKADTRARLESQGLTGVASIALIGGTPAAADVPGDVANPPVIAAEQSEIQNILETLQRLTVKVDSAMTQVERLVSANAESINNTIKNVEKFSVALGENSDGIKQFMSSVSELGKTLKPIVSNLETLTKNLNERIAAIEPDKLKTIIANAERISGTFAGSVENFDKLVKENSPAISETVKNVQGFTKTLADNKEGVNKLIASLSDLGKTLDPAMKNFEKITADISKRVEAVDDKSLKKIVSNAEALSSKLIGSADKLDKVLASLDKILGSGDTKGVMADVSEAAKAIRVLAQNLDQRTKVMATGINRFTGAGLRQYEALAADGRRTIRQLDQAIRSLQKNPQQVIFGSRPAIPEYSGR